MNLLIKKIYPIGFIIMLAGCGGKASFEASNRAILSESGTINDLPQDADAKIKKIHHDDSIGEVVEVQSPPNWESLPEVIVEPNIIERQFVSADFKEVSLSLQENYIEIEKELKMIRGENEGSDNFKQIERSIVSKEFVQGTAGKIATENLKQDELGILDILVVVDNSVSMRDEQEKVSVQLPKLIESIKNSNWNIRVVSTDAGRDMCNRYPVIKGPAKNQAEEEALSIIFGNQVKGLGTRGSGDERGIQMAHRGLDCPADPWIRDGSSIAVLIVSDEDNCSRGTCSPLFVKDHEINLLKLMQKKITGGETKRTIKEDARIYGIFWKPGTPCPNRVNGAQGHKYEQLVTNGGGTSGSICDANFTSTFENISKDLEKSLKSNFVLAHTPVEGSISVGYTLEDNSIKSLTKDIDYTIKEKIIEFTQTPPPGAKMQFNYRYDPTPKFQEVDLKEATGKILTVTKKLPGKSAVNLTSPVDFNLDGTVIKFTKEPEDNAIIRAEFRKALPILRNEFVITKNARPDSIKLTVNGEEKNFSYNTMSGIATLNESPKDGANIVFSYKVPFVGDMVRSFAADAGYNNFIDVKGFDTDSGDPISVSLNEGMFVVDADDFKEGRKVSIQYRVQDFEMSSNLNLAFEPYTDSLEILLISQNGTEVFCNPNQYSISEKILRHNCQIEDLLETKIRYHHLVTGEQVFDIGKEASLEGAEVIVTIDGEEVSDYTINNNKLIMKDLLANKSIKLKIAIPQNPKK